MINNVNKWLAMALLLGLVGCDKQPDPAPPPVQAAAPVVQPVFDAQVSESVGYKLLTADRGKKPSLSVDALLIGKLDRQLADLSRLTGLEEIDLADMALSGAKAIRQEPGGPKVSAAEVLDMLATVVPLQTNDLDSPGTDKNKLVASSIGHYGSLRLNGLSHKEAVNGFAALLRKIASPDFAEQVNRVMNKQ